MIEHPTFEGQTRQFVEADNRAPSSPRPQESWHEPGMPPTRRVKRRRRFGALLLMAGIVLLLVSLFGVRVATVGLVEGTLVTTQEWSGHNIALEVGAGDVTLVSGSGSAVQVEVTRHGYGWNEAAGRRAAETLQLPEMRLDGDTVRVKDRNHGRVVFLGRSPSTSYRVSLPPNGNVVVKTGSGDIHIEGMAVTDPTLETTSGTINVESASGVIKASSSSGDIMIDEGTNATLDLETGSGTIKYAGSLGEDRAHRVQTGSGDIELRLPAGTNARVEARTGSGDIRSDWQLSGGDDTPQRAGQVGRGGQMLQVRTDSGTIEIKQH